MKSYETLKKIHSQWSFDIGVLNDLQTLENMDLETPH